MKEVTFGQALFSNILDSLKSIIAAFYLFIYISEIILSWVSFWEALNLSVKGNGWFQKTTYKVKRFHGSFMNHWN